MAKVQRTAPALTFGSGQKLRNYWATGVAGHILERFIVWSWRRRLFTGPALFYVFAIAWTGSVVWGFILGTAVLAGICWGVLRSGRLGEAEAINWRDARKLIARRRRLLERWPAACETSGLSGTKTTAAPYPGLRQLQFLPDGGMRAKVHPTTAGRTVRALQAASTDLAEKVGCKALFVTEVGTGVAELDFYWSDPLEHVLPLTQLPLPPKGRLSYGVRGGRGVAASIDYTRSVLIGGQTGAGKSNIIHALVADANRQRLPLRLYISDPKAGMELGAYGRQLGIDHGLFEVRDYARTTAETIKMLDRVEDAMQARMRALEQRRIRRWEPSAIEPITVVIIDELLALQALLKKGTDSSLARIVFTGRACGYSGWLCTQEGTVETLGQLRKLIPQRIAVATESATQTRTILGDAAIDNGAGCHLLTEPGLGYSADEGTRNPSKFRAALVTDRQVEMIVTGRYPQGMLLPGGRRRCATYVYWDEAERCLYVGKAFDPVERRKQHKDKPWYEEIWNENIQWYDSEQLAFEAEKRLIAELKPLHNAQHNTRNPDRIIRDAYGKVIGRGRLAIDHAKMSRAKAPDDAGLAIVDDTPTEPQKPATLGDMW